MGDPLFVGCGKGHLADFPGSPDSIIDFIPCDHVVKPDALGVDVSPRLTTLKVVEPPKRKGGGKVADAKELVAKLRNEAKVIS